MGGPGLHGGLHGRRRECDALDAARDGRSQVLVLRGEPGVGKTSLLDHAQERAGDCRVLRTAGVESEVELAFAGLHQLCGPVLDGLDRLPEPQAEALGTAFGLRVGATPDTFFIGLAVLGLLADAAEERPLVCLVDDAQWLDRASAHALAFVARRLLADPVALVFAQRDDTAHQELDGLPQLVVGGLEAADAGALLDATIPGRLDPLVRRRIIAETGGNPLALGELTRGRTPQDLAGGFAVAAVGPLTSRIERSFEERVRSLPPSGQVLLRLAAAEPVGDAPLLWRAASVLGVGADAATAVEASGLLEIGTGVRFSHPIVRSVAYRSGSPRDRREAHRALAEATDGATDPDRRAWHRGRAAVEPDEDVASDLERAAATARRRGGPAAVAAFLTQATALTPEPVRRGGRALDAAVAALAAAAPADAAELVTAAERCPLDDLQQATATRLRARIAYAERHGHDAPALLLDAARRLEPLDPALAREAHLEAMEAGIYAGRMILGPRLGDLAEAARRSAPTGDGTGLVDLLVDGLATRLTEGYVDAVAPLRRVLDRLRRDDDPDGDLDRLWLGCRIAAELWEDELLDELAERQLRRARATGALTVLPLAVSYRAGVHVHHGELDAAAALSAESNALTASVGGPPVRYAEALTLAWRGDETSYRELIGAGVQNLIARGEGRSLSWAEYCVALMANGAGRYAEAVEAVGTAVEHDDLAVAGWALFELVEAAARADRPDVAGPALERLVERTDASGTGWALGVQARSRALLADDRAAEELYREAVERLAGTRVVVHRARTHLVFGEWLRRQNRRVDAREQLRAAHEMFSRFGAEGFAERARRELLATGETARRRRVAEVEALTAQESEIARLARDGHTNPEIGSQLFISPRTVEYHLRKVFTKLGISSRRELRRALLDPS